jgi:hypothetical protein
MKGTGCMARLKDTVNIDKSQEATILDLGRMINSMDMARKPGLMA